MAAVAAACTMNLTMLVVRNALMTFSFRLAFPSAAWVVPLGLCGVWRDS
jgi:hypothetical protein